MLNKPIKVLLVEDNPGDARLIKEMLKEASEKGFLVKCEDRLSKGIEQLKENGVDILLLDLGLPDSQGIETFYKASAEAPHLPIILLTGLDDVNIAVNALSRGAQDYLIKDNVNGSILAQSIRYSMERKNAEKKIKRLNHILRAIRNVNQLITREKDPHRLIERACEILVGTRGYRHTWISLFGEDEDAHILSQSGIGKDFNILKDQIEEGILPECARRALEISDIIRISAPESYCSGCPLEGKVAQSECLTLRLEYEGKTFGILSASLPEEYMADEQEKELLIELATDISFALHDIKLTKMRQQAEDALRKNEKYFRSLTENSFDTILILDREGKIRYVSPSVERVLGYKKNERIFDTSFEFIHPEDRDYVIGKFNEAISNPGIPSVINLRIKHKDGSWRFVEGAGRSLFHDPAVEGFVINFRDITDRRQAELELQKSEERLKGFMDSATEAFVVFDSSLNCIEVNKKALNIWPRKIKKGDVIGKNIEYFFPRIKEKQRYNQYLKVLETGVPLRIDDLVVDSIFGDIRIDLSVFKVENGLGMIATDVSERKKIEDTLKESEEKYRKLFNSSPLSIILLDLEGNVTDCNNTAQILLGLEKNECIGKSIHELIGNLKNDHKLKLKKMLLKLLTEKKTASVEIKRIQTDGESRWLEVFPALLKKDGKPYAMQVIIEDITDRKRMEKEMIRNEKIQSIGVLAGGIAHDFNNILMAIMGNITLARMQAGSQQEICGMLAEAENAAYRARDLTQQLLTFSKGGAPIKKTTSIVGLIRESAGFALRGSNVRCSFVVTEDVRLVEIDEGQISQVINNLVINADQAMPEGGTITIHIENVNLKDENIPAMQDDNLIKISIKDEGVGIPPEYISKIFDPYFTTKQKGSGLGLASVYSIINKHEGYINVTSEFGKGTTFTFYLPASDKKAVAKRESPEIYIVKGTGKILFMDDEEDIRKFISRMLKSLGYEVVLACEGREALELYKEAAESGKPFDAIILDLTIPGGMGGKETIKELLEFDPRVKAVVSSGYSNDPIMAQYEDYGFSGVIVKPYRLNELSMLLQKLTAK